MIGKTTEAAGVATQTIRRAIARETPRAGDFAAALAAQTQPSGLARAASAEDGGRVSLRAATTTETSEGRTPLGHRAGAAADESAGRQAVSPQRSAGEGTTSGSTAPADRPNYSTADAAIVATGSLSEDARTEGMYVPPDFYHGNSYSPVFDRQDENGNWVPTPRFEGQIIYSPWRGSLPDDFDPNARVVRDPLAFGNGPNFWKQNEDGTWTKRETGYGGIPLYDNGKPVFTPDPLLYPEYFKA